MIVNQANLYGLNISYSTAYNKAFDTTQTNYQAIATTVQSSTAEQSYAWLGQFPKMKEWIGEREIQSIAAYDYSIKNRNFEMTIGVPRDAIEDDQYGVYTPLFSNMGECAALHPDELVFETLINGFSKKCYDGESFFSNKHKMEENTFSNVSHDPLSREAFKKARTSIMSITGDKGKSLNLVPDLLIVSPANEENASLILEADQINGTSNVLKGKAKVLVTTQLAANPDMWFLACTNKFLKPIILQERKKIVFTSLTKETDVNVFMDNQFVYGADGRSNSGYGFWQMIYGSDGGEAEAQG